MSRSSPVYQEVTNMINKFLLYLIICVYLFHISNYDINKIDLIQRYEKQYMNYILENMKDEENKK